MCRFSILITTRTRVDMLNHLLKSIYDNTVNKEEVEIRIIYDTDDYLTDSYIQNNFKQNYGENPSIKTYFHSRERSVNLVSDYHNWATLNFAQGKYILYVNDDAIFETGAWDEITWKVLSEYETQYPDGILYGMPEDFEREPSRSEQNWMACFPLLSKKAIDIMGYAFDPMFTRDGADWALAQTFRHIKRIVDLRLYLVIKHLSFRSGRRQKDDLDMYADGLGLWVPATDKAVEKNSEKLMSYINQYNDSQKEKEIPHT